MNDTLTTEWWRAGGPGPATTRDMMTARGEPLPGPGLQPNLQQITAARTILATSLAAHRLGPLIDEAKALGAGVSSVTLTTMPSGNVSVQIVASSDGATIAIAERLGCPPPERATNGRNAWLSAELGEYGDPLRLSVIGGHRPVCQCHLDGIPQHDPEMLDEVELGIEL